MSAKYICRSTIVAKATIKSNPIQYRRHSKQDFVTVSPLTAHLQIKFTNPTLQTTDKTVHKCKNNEV